MKSAIDKIFGFSDMGIVQGRNIPKKIFYEQDAFNASRKKLFTDDIENLRISAICDRNTTNIEAYVNEDRNYKEIFFIQVILKDASKHKKISEIMHQVIPNPVVIIFIHKKSLLLSAAHKRLNKQEKGKIVVEAEYNSPWVSTETSDETIQKFIKQLYLKNFNFDNLYVFYSDITKAIIFSSFIELVRAYKYSRACDIKKISELADRFKKLQEKKVFHVNADKKLKNFGDKVSNHQQLLDTQKELDKIKQILTKFD
ncbi:MAG: DUF4391 domain-containing protein [Nanoarchaeota archaeon]|nr:DUF4391 domain-containing protein [Nanoarchaeota archaeon]